ncbi:hypothetical protein [Yunchengibacter salinarum]|uniref:hypothetical protein n=1 Tax=Yunchengibacter salinarum TaxID=3133399 RepID=UPI0035B571C8
MTTQRPTGLNKLAQTLLNTRGTLYRGADVNGLSPHSDAFLDLCAQTRQGPLLHRDLVTPRRFRRFLSGMTIFEPIIENGGVADALIRLVGTETATDYGEVAGTYVSGYSEREIRERVLAALHMVVTDGAPVCVMGTFSSARFHKSVLVAYVPLTLREGGTQVDQVISYGRVHS